MTTRDFLERPRRLDGEIDSLLEAQRLALDRISAAGKGPWEAGGEDLGSYLKLEEKLNRRIDELLRAKEEILEVIFRVSDSMLRRLLVERYINGKTWEQVAEALTYSYSQVVKYKYPAALRAVERVRRGDRCPARKTAAS